MSIVVSPQSVVAALVERGLVAPERSAEALAVIGPLLRPEHQSGSAPVRRRLAEVAGYVGAAFVIGAAVLFLSTTWSDLGPWTQVGLLLASALVLAGVGAGAVGTGGGRLADPVRRRLGSVLLTGSAGCAAFGAGVAMAETSASEELVVLVAAATGLVGALGGYRWAPSVVSQLGAAVAAATMLPSGLGALDTGSQSIVPLAVAFVVLGGAWQLAAERRWWRELQPARGIGCVLAVLGAQLPVVVGDAETAGYLLTLGVALAAFGGYLGSRAWPHLATGLVGLTLVVPEALHDWFGESLGVAGVLLAAGVTLLVVALLGLRLRREVSQA